MCKLDVHAYRTRMRKVPFICRYLFGTSVSGLRFMFFVFNREIIIIANNEHSM